MIFSRNTAGAPIKAPVMNITLGSLGTLSLAGVLTAFNSSFEFVFGEGAPDSIRASVLIAVIAAITVIAASDMLARAIATQRTPRYIAPWAGGWKARIINDPPPDEDGFIVAAMRVSASDRATVEYLLVKADCAPIWKEANQIVLKPPDVRAGSGAVSSETSSEGSGGGATSRSIFGNPLFGSLPLHRSGRRK